MSRTLALLAVLALLALAGCGAADGGAAELEGEERAVADAVEALQDAAQDRDERAICGRVLAPAVAGRLGDCPRQIRAVLDRADTTELEVRDVTLVGRDRARARVRTGPDSENERIVGLVRSPEGWRIADLGRPVPAAP